MPFKANAGRRQHIPKQRLWVMNPAAHDAALRQRGSLAVWFTEEAIATWKAEPRTTRGIPRFAGRNLSARSLATVQDPGHQPTDLRPREACPSSLQILLVALGGSHLVPQLQDLPFGLVGGVLGHFGSGLGLADTALQRVDLKP